MGTKYDYAAGMTDAQKKAARRAIRTATKAAGVFIPHAPNADNVRLTLAPVTAPTGQRTAPQGQGQRTAPTGQGQYIIGTVAAFMALVKTGASVTALVPLTAPEVLAVIRDVMALFGPEDGPTDTAPEDEDTAPEDGPTAPEDEDTAPEDGAV